jgi:hypothetical protein
VFGSRTGKWTTDKFIETVYREVANDKTQQARKQ